MIDLSTLTIQKAHDLLKDKQLTVKELVDLYLDVIKEKNKDINAYIEIFSDIEDQVTLAQKRYDEGTATVLTGIPIAVKDNILIQGKIASAGSKILSNYTASYSATAIKNLEKQNVVFIGRTNMDEFAMGSSTETSAYGNTKNPIDISLVPGGSSGGSAAAVKMNGALVSLGSETCGSIRQPAAFCGLVGFKPTYGVVSRYGLIAMGSSLDQIGPFGKTVEDVKILHEALASYDPQDSTSIPEEKRIPRKKEGSKGTIGIPKAFLEGPGINEEVLTSFWQTVSLLKEKGYTVEEISLPLAPYSLAVYYILMPAESSTNLARFDGIRYGRRVESGNLIETYKKSRGEGFGREVRRRIVLGTYVLSHGYYDAYYNKAVQVRNALIDEMYKAFDKVDYILTPTAPTFPFKLGEKLSDPVSMYLSDIFSAPANLSGCPAIAIPTGSSSTGLPTSIQITAPRFCEDSLFEIGKDIESLV